MNTNAGGKDQYMTEHRCVECGEVCEVIVKQWQEKENFWGAPCWRDCYEDVSQCCQAEAEEIEEDKSRAN